MTIEYLDEFKKASNYHQNGNLKKAQIIYEKILKYKPDFAEVINMLGVIFYQKKNYTRAISLINKSIELNKYSATFQNNLGNVYKDIEKYTESIECYNSALKIQPNHFGSLYNLGIVYKKINNFNKATLFFKKAIEINPGHLDCYINLGHTELILKNFQESLKCFNFVISCDSKNSRAYHGRALVFLYLKKFDQALENFNYAISFDNKFYEFYNDRGVLFHDLGQYEKAILDYTSALKIKEDSKHLLGNYFNSIMKICDWKKYSYYFSKMSFFLKKNIDVCKPFIFLGLVDDPYLQKQVTFNYVKKNFITKQYNQSLFTKKKRNKIVVGYFSPDFRNHPVSNSIHEVLQNHDTNKFEIYGFYCGPETGVDSEMYKNISKNFKKFFNINHLTDFEVAKLSRKIGIDIAIDLAGHTNDARTEIFLHGCAPIQINYLGYPGTLCVDGIDYIIADKVLITKEQLDTVSENIIYLDCYLPNEKIKKLNIANLSKKKLNLPENKFIFCCFNSSWKITPDMFDLWMNILKSIPNCVLWLLKQNSFMVNNLKKEALIRGVDQERIIFADYLPTRMEHINRQSFANLFLDTYPYGAHTTCADSLRSNVPVLTISGKSFASKVSSSILKKLNLNECITTSFDEYIRRAIYLANNPFSLEEIKNKLSKNIESSDLFNPKSRTKILEDVYYKVYNNYFKNKK